MELIGIDVSEHNQTVLWETVKPQIDFAIIRAGYGQNNIDKQFKRNIEECTRLGIPFGIYWFSYALDPDMARREAEYCIKAIGGYNPLYPICFDYEYDSYNYACRQGKKPSKDLIIKIAEAFLSTVENNGYYAVNYCNIDYYYNYGMKQLTDKYDLWLADWREKKENIKCGMLQFSSKKTFNGINGVVDADYAYKDYPTIINNMNKTNAEKENKKNEQIVTASSIFINKYLDVALEIIDGLWGNGEQRKVALTNAGYDYDFAQHIVNKLYDEGIVK